MFGLFFVVVGGDENLFKAEFFCLGNAAFYLGDRADFSAEADFSCKGKALVYRDVKVGGEDADDGGKIAGRVCDPDAAGHI